MITIIYVGIAVVFLIVVLGAIASTSSTNPGDCAAEKDLGSDLGQARWFHLSERIFDSSDVRWLREDLAFPTLADSLANTRRQLAIRWLTALKASFDELVRTPELAQDEAPAAASVASWQMLWLTIRFQFLLSYALLVVRLFGPYHRLIPSFDRVPFSLGVNSAIQRPIFSHDKAR